MKRHILLLGTAVLLIGLPMARGQSIWPSTINASGGSANIGGNNYEWSIGEMTMVSTFTTSTIILTQGLLQPGAGTTGIKDNTLLVDLQVFPNPSSSLINIQYNALSEGTLNCRLMDVTGKILIESSINIKQGQNTRQLDISSLAAATYMLNIGISTTNGAEETTTYKMQKLQ